MPANQLFPDWVTGDLITASKLNQMKNDLAALSGATFSGAVTVNNTASVQTLQTKVGTSTGGSSHLQLWNGSLRWAVGLQGTEGTGNAGSNFSVWRYTDTGGYLAKALDINRATGFGTFYGDWYATDGSNGVQLRSEGGIEIIKDVPYIDFKDSYAEDYDVRLIKRLNENTLEVVGNLWLDGGRFIELRQNASYALRMWSHTDGRFVMAPVDDGSYQWDREFGYDPATDKWYCETRLTVPGLDSASPITMMNGIAAQEIYVRKVRASHLWTINDANDPGDGGLFVNGRAFIQNASGLNGTPAIALAIGDNDTGLNWSANGVIQMCSNGTVIGTWGTSVGLSTNVRLQTNVGSDLHWVMGKTDGTARWRWKLNGSEAGGNTGSQLELSYMTDSAVENTRLRLPRNVNEFEFFSPLRPALDNSYTLGNSSFRWSAVWAANGTIQTSDAREKTDVQPTPLGLEFIERLRPVAYRWRVGGYVDEPIIEERQVQTGTDAEGNPIYETERHARPNPVPIPGKRLHHGLIAQEVKAALDELGVDFGGWVLTDPADPDSQQALRYDQFIAPLIRAVQELSARVRELEARCRSI